MNLMPVKSKMMDVLLVDDSDDDVELMRLAFHEARLMLRLNRVENGEQCMAYLRRQGEYAEATQPDLILLDLNMPVMDGREVLAQIVVDEALRQLPVVILTTSADDRDILQMYKLRCSSYIVKPVDFNQFVRVVRGIGNYWFTVVVLPH